MGNCQAIDSATLVIQHPSGKADKLYWPVAASEIMKMNPGHYVALLLTTTVYSSPSAAAADGGGGGKKNGGALNDSKSTPVKITRIKLLRPTDTLVLGHVYRLVTSQEVMKGLLAKKQAKMNKQKSPDFEAVVRKSDAEKTNLVKHEKQRSRSSNNNNTAVKCAVSSKSRGWQPSLNSISEAGS